MHILYLCHADNYHVQKWIPALKRAGAKITVGTLRPDHDFNGADDQIALLPRPLSNHFDFARAAHAVSQLFNKIKPDVVLASYAPGYGWSAVLAGVRPLVVQTWSRDAELPGSLVSFTDHAIVKTLGRHILRKSDGVTADGLYCKEVLMKNLGLNSEKIHATPWGIDLTFFSEPERYRAEKRASLGITSSETVLFCPRGVYWYYQPEIVLPALLAILERNPTLKIILPLLNHSVKKGVAFHLKQLQNHSRVHMLPSFVSPDEMRRLFAASDFFLSAPKFDGVSEAITEGRAMGSIPILNRIGSNLERVIEGFHGLYVDDTNSKKLADSVLQAMQTSIEDQQNIRRNNFRWVKCFGDVRYTATGLLHYLGEIRKNYQAYKP
jgi:glycosyltransferase involved in cell wall biosynthesis